MASFNKITLVGYLGKDPELRQTLNGDAVCSFSVATTERRKNATGDNEDQTTWFKVTVWRRQAEIANQYLTKGKQVYVEGRLRQTEYTDRDGNRRSALEVTASDIQFMGSKDDGEGRESRNADQGADRSAMDVQAPAKSHKAKQATLPGTHDDSSGYIDEDSIPF